MGEGNSWTMESHGIEQDLGEKKTVSQDRSMARMEVDLSPRQEEAGQPSDSSF